VDDLTEIETEQGISKDKVERIFGFDKSIRFVILLSSEGNVIASFNKPGVTSLEPEKESNGLFMRAALTYSVSTQMDKYHGRLRAAILVRDKVTLICFMLVERIMMVSADPEFSMGKLDELGQLIDELSID
jgi:hypothetical protein